MGFWRGYEGPAAVVWKVLNWAAPNAHNGFLDIWLGLGLLGLAVFIVFFGHLLWRAITAIHPNSPPEALWPLCYVVFVFLYNIDETDLFQKQQSDMDLARIRFCITLSVPMGSRSRTRSDLAILDPS